ncbi:MAG: putative rane protein [Ramlibacter sp.]|nr:putative rane protein [Ramlibacter sp.]
MNLRQLLTDLRRFPWKSMALTVGERFREDRLSLTASSLTFTTTIALVPFFTVALAIFTAFPVFNQVQVALQTWLVQSLVPDTIARQVLGYLTQFAGKASRLGAVGLGALIVTTLALILTIDRTLNSLWRVRRPRPLWQRVLIYWAVLTLGPLLLGLSVSSISYVISLSRGLVGAMPGSVRFAIDVVQFVLLSGGLAALYRHVPHTHVRRSHAWAGAMFAAIGIELARKLLTLYFGTVPTYSMVYGAFATLPILLVWIYVAWVIVLLGAVIAACLPGVLLGAGRRSTAHGWQFQIALEVLQELVRSRASERHGRTATELARGLHLDPLQLEQVLETLVGLDWVGRINEIEDEADTRYMLLADPQSTPLEPLMRQLLIADGEATARLWRVARLSEVSLKDVVSA